MTTVLANIGLLATNDPALGDGLVGALRDAWVVFGGEQIIDVGTGAPPAADEMIDAKGRAVIPGFVDSHTHLVFAGDRSAEFVARMAGEPYAAGGIATTVDATRNASRHELISLTAHRRAEALRAGITTVEIKSGYGLTVDDEVRCLDIAREFTPETTFLGAHLLPTGFEGRTDDYIDLVCGDMLDAAAPYSRWIDAFCEVGAFDADQCRRVIEAGRARGLGGRLHANQLGFGPGVQVAVETGCASADHCTYLTDVDISMLAASDTVATFLPIADFSTRQPYPDARRVIDAGATVALATNCNPGSSYSTSMSLAIALAVRDMNMTADEALWAATAGGARALRRDDVGRVSPGLRADLVILGAPSWDHLVYRPGAPLIDAVIARGRSTPHP